MHTYGIELVTFERKKEITGSFLKLNIYNIYK